MERERESIKRDKKSIALMKNEILQGTINVYISIHYIYRLLQNIEEDESYQGCLSVSDITKRNVIDTF